MADPTLTATLDKATYEPGEPLTLTVDHGGIDSAAGKITVTVTTDDGTVLTDEAHYEITSADRRLRDGEHYPDGFTVPAGEVWEFAPGDDVTVTTAANVVVHGTLRMRPADIDVEHRLTFVGIDESQVLGGGHAEPMATDVGLWVVGDGILDLQGTPRAGWNTTGTDPSWAAGDEVYQAPYRTGDFTTFAPHPYGAPAPTVGNGLLADVRTEVFNLTRNVVIGGTPAGRAHVIFLHAHQPQTIKHARFEHVGPRKVADDGVTDLILGRYGLHFHHGGDHTRGSLLEGVVIAHCGSRAFVPHASHGITFRDCIAYDVANEGYWWDKDTRDTYPRNATFDVTYDHCAAFGVGDQPNTRNFGTLAAFDLGQGAGNSCIGCVAAGHGQPTPKSSGFAWQEETGKYSRPWLFRGCVGHNNRTLAVYMWQGDPNEGPVHVLEDWLFYRNGSMGIMAGPYAGTTEYLGGTSAENAVTQFSAEIGWGGYRLQGLRLDPAGRAPYALRLPPHRTFKPEPVLVVDCDMRAGTKAVVGVEQGTNPGYFDFVRVTVDGSRDLEPEDFHLARIAVGSRLRVQRSDGTAFEITDTGTRPIDPFSPNH